jgi:phage baseplate assembly protein W
LKDIAAVKAGVKNVILTKFGEKFFNYTFGSRVNSLLFENYHALTLAGMKLEIQDALAKYEPRIILEDVRTTSLPNTNELIVSIIFLLKNQLDKRVEFNFILTRVR